MAIGCRLESGGESQMGIPVHRILALFRGGSAEGKQMEGEMRRKLIWLVMAVAAIAPAFGSSINVNLNTASTFGLLGGTISNTGNSVVTGDVGATTTITGFDPITGPGTATGTIYTFPSNPTADHAYSDFVSAFNTAQLDPSTQTFAGLTTSQTFLGNNVYLSTATDVSSTTGINLTFNGQNASNPVFIIQIPGALTVNGAMTFTLENGAKAHNIFWIVGNIATISVGSKGPITFDGNILAGTSFTMSAASGGSGVLAGTIDGCVFAETANTLGGYTNVGGCADTTAGGPTGGGGGSGAIPEPASAGLVSLGGLIGILVWRKLRIK